LKSISKIVNIVLKAKYNRRRLNYYDEKY